MSDTARQLQALYDSAPNARLILDEGALVVDVPEKNLEDTANDVVAVVLTREALIERFPDADGGPSSEALHDFASTVDDMAAKMGA